MESRMALTSKAPLSKTISTASALESEVRRLWSGWGNESKGKQPSETERVVMSAWRPCVPMLTQAADLILSLSDLLGGPVL
eukprot:7396871-Pyramimonas_sp.AAC.1